MSDEGIDLDIEANAVYEPEWTTSKRYIIVMGGRGAGRSFETSQRTGALLVQTARPFRAALMRAVHSDIRHSNWQELVDRVNAWSIESVVHIADSTMEMEYKKNSVHAHGFRKSSSDRTAKLKSLANYTYAHIEEGEEIGEAEFQQLDDSLRAEGSQIVITLNTPAKSHWIIQRWFNVIAVPDAPGFYRVELKLEAANDVEFIFSTHRDNPYIPEEVHTRYESYRLTKPKYYWNVISGLCPETVMGRIYTGWREIDEIPFEARLLGRGLDFGFDPDPAALLDVYYYNGGYILDEQVYATKLTNDELATKIKLLPHPDAPIIGDSAEPKSIQELRDRDVFVTPASKGADSVNFGIKHVQSLKVSYTKRSKRIKAEVENYAWKRTKDSVDEDEHLGIEDPACANHLMSAFRYFAMEMIKADADPEAEDRRRIEVVRARHEHVERRADTGVV